MSTAAWRPMQLFGNQGVTPDDLEKFRIKLLINGKLAAIPHLGIELMP